MDSMKSNLKRQAKREIGSFYKEYPITSLIIAVNLIAFVFTLFNGGFFSVQKLISMGALYEPLVLKGEVHRLIVSLFLHAGFFHLLFNLLTLAIISSKLEKFIGTQKFLIVYFISGIVANILVLVVNSENVVAVGASGSIFGTLGILSYMIFKKSHLIPKQYHQSIIVLVVINFVFTFLDKNISIASHVGGFVTGCLLGIFILTKKSSRYKKSDFAEQPQITRKYKKSHIKTPF